MSQSIIVTLILIEKSGLALTNLLIVREISQEHGHGLGSHLVPMCFMGVCRT